jgi:hypothetical protein
MEAQRAGSAQARPSGRDTVAFRERAPKVRHKTFVPVLRTSVLCLNQPRPHGRGYSLPALRAFLRCISVVQTFPSCKGFAGR